MADFHKIAMLILNKTGTQFLVCKRDKESVTDEYTLPGGQVNDEMDTECLKREVAEELSCTVNVSSLAYIGEYADAAAGRPGETVALKLYQGKLRGTPKVSAETTFLRWIGKEDVNNWRISPMVRNKIIPDLILKKILV